MRYDNEEQDAAISQLLDEALRIRHPDPDGLQRRVMAAVRKELEATPPAASPVIGRVGQWTRALAAAAVVALAGGVVLTGGPPAPTASPSAPVASAPAPLTPLAPPAEAVAEGFDRWAMLDDPAEADELSQRITLLDAQLALAAGDDPWRDAPATLDEAVDAYETDLAMSDWSPVTGASGWF